MCHKYLNHFIFLDLFGKAKKKILKQDEMSDSFVNSIPSTTRQRSPELNWGPQEIGIDKEKILFDIDLC